MKAFKTEKEIKERLASLGAELTQRLKNSEPVFIGVLDDCFIFYSDLVRHIEMDLQCEFVWKSSMAGIKSDLKDKTIVLVFGACPEKPSLEKLLSRLQSQSPREILKVCLVVNSEQKNALDYFGFEGPVVEGYGLGVSAKRFSNRIFEREK